jgi:hypothetical protein
MWVIFTYAYVNLFLDSCSCYDTNVSVPGAGAGPHHVLVAAHWPPSDSTRVSSAQDEPPAP